MKEGDFFGQVFNVGFRNFILNQKPVHLFSPIHFMHPHGVVDYRSHVSSNFVMVIQFIYRNYIQVNGIG